MELRMLLNLEVFRHTGDVSGILQNLVVFGGSLLHISRHLQDINTPTSAAMLRQKFLQWLGWRAWRILWDHSNFGGFDTLRMRMMRRMMMMMMMMMMIFDECLPLFSDFMWLLSTFAPCNSLGNVKRRCRSNVWVPSTKPAMEILTGFLSSNFEKRWQVVYRWEVAYYG